MQELCPQAFACDDTLESLIVIFVPVTTVATLDWFASPFRDRVNRMLQLHVHIASWSLVTFTFTFTFTVAKCFCGRLQSRIAELISISVEAKGHEYGTSTCKYMSLAGSATKSTFGSSVPGSKQFSVQR